MSLPDLLTAKEVKEYLKCNNTTLYALLKERTFPSFRIGSRYYIEKEKFILWMDRKEKERK